MTSTAQDDVTVQLDRLDEAGQSLLFTGARTAHTFADTPVTSEELEAIWELAKWPPTALNAQPLRVVFVQSPEARQKLVDNMMEGNKAKTLAAPAVAVLAYDAEFHEHLPAVAPAYAHMKDGLDANDEMRNGMAGSNANIQAGYFILATRARGLAAGPMGGFDRAGVDAAFFPDGRFKSVLVVNIGHPAKDAYHPRQARLEHETTVVFA